LGRPDHGGDFAKGKRKGRRPLDPKRPIHLVLRSGRAKGAWSFLHRHHRSKVETLVYSTAVARGVRVYRLSNVGNHLHLLLRTPSREAFQDFLRTLTALLARAVTGARKGRPLRTGGEKLLFWDGLAYTRVLHWGRHFEAVMAYLSKNDLEAIGFGGAKLRFRSNGQAVAVLGASVESLMAQGLDRAEARKALKTAEVWIKGG
jgi:hypothetical protein